jgi:hypothetical protein
MKFQTVSIVKHHINAVWVSMRDDLPAVTSRREDIHSVTEQERHASPRICRIVNVWKARTKLPPAAMRLLDADMFVWTDRAEWNNETRVCTWSIEPHHFRDSICCHGTTAFEPAVGGTGTRITFSGDLEWDSAKLLGLAGGMGEAVFSSAEGIIRNVIQKNFRKVADAVALHLDELKKNGESA